MKSLDLGGLLKLPSLVFKTKSQMQFMRQFVSTRSLEILPLIGAPAFDACPDEVRHALRQKQSMRTSGRRHCKQADMGADH
ncbi:MAG: hypothetical protein EBT08_01480, partial [Betaproteobacteria bacterium]|nr:hypothetical protein [Betaproteobacteria bacterium]